MECRLPDSRIGSRNRNQSSLWRVSAMKQLLAISLVVGTVVAARAGREITVERLNHADKEPDNWLVYGGTYRSLRHSPLRQINTRSVRTLQAAWAFQMGSVDHGVQVTPLVADGVMYVAASNQRIFAINAATGTQKWAYTY